MKKASKPSPEDTEVKSYILSGDFRGAILNIESTFVDSKIARDIEDQPPEPGDPPYKGLQYFDEADAEHFLGREKLTATLAGRLRETRFLAVIGASGSGKSSVVRAGLIPALRVGKQLADGSLPPSGSHQWLIRVMTPTEFPLDALATAALPDANPGAVTALRDRMVDAPSALADFAAGPEGAGQPRLMLVVDQFEEAFSLVRHEETRRAFIDNLVAAATTGDRVLVVIILRADFYDRCAQYEGLRQLVSRHQEYIGAMNRSELSHVIVIPAARAGWKFQTGLAELMLDDVGDEPGALPLLSHALLETWKRRRGRTMTLSGYKEAGGVRGAITKTADTVYRERLTEPQQDIARLIFLRLTELGESADSESPDTRRRVVFSELITRTTDVPTLDAVLSILVDARLITTDIVPPNGTRVVEVCHEALIREWPTLRDWLSKDREGLIRHRQLTADVNEWLNLDRDPGALYRGVRLNQTQEWAAGWQDSLSLIEQEFLETSASVAAEEARRQARAARTQRVLAGVAAVLLVAVAGFVLFNLGVFTPPDRMDGDFNIAVAEFAVLDAEGNLTNDDHEGGVRVAERIGMNLEREFAERPEVLVWYDSPELESEHHVTIGVAGSPPLEAKSPAELAEELNADMVIYGEAEPAGATSDLTLRFYLRPQFGADFSQMVGNHEFKTAIPVFDASDPAEEVWRNLDPLASALAWLTLGLRQEILGEQNQAVQSFEEAATFAPDSDVIQYFIGQEYFYRAQASESPATEDLASAGTAFAESLRLNPDNPRARIGQGAVHFVTAQRMLNEARNLPDGDEKTAALEAVRQEAQAALEAYDPIVSGPEQIEEYGVPVAGIARQGRGISLRILAEVAYFLGNPTEAETHIDQAIAALEDNVPQLVTANDPRLAAQSYQALGSFYEWKSFLLMERGATDSAAAARETALSYYNDCVQQGEDFPFDTYLVDRIVGRLCVPRVASLQQG